MKKQILAGAVVAALWGAVALADDAKKPCPPKDQQSSMSTSGESSSQYGQTEVTPTEQQPAQAAQQPAQPEQQQSAVGGSGEQGMDTTAQQPPPAYVAPVVVVNENEKTEKKSSADMKGVTVSLGGGVEGYTGQLAPVINPGLAYGLNINLRPTRALGFELGYDGAVNNLDRDAGNGADLVRNGGHAALTLGLTPTAVQPYVLGGVGINHYNARNTSVLKDDTSGYIPLGIGLRTHMGHFTADLRGTWSAMFDNEIASVETQSIVGVDIDKAGRLAGLLQVGSTF